MIHQSIETRWWQKASDNIQTRKKYQKGKKQQRLSIQDVNKAKSWFFKTGNPEKKQITLTVQEITELLVVKLYEEN